MIYRSHCSWYPKQLVCAFLPLLCQRVTANTEIINFLSEQQRSVDLPRPVVGNWVTLNFSHNEHQWALQPAPLGTPLHEVCETDNEISPTGEKTCPHQIWVALDLDDWTNYRAFTLRLSWPASAPADFLIELYSPDSSTRTKYARIRVVDTGVPTPQIHPDDTDSRLSNLVEVEPVPFILILEHLYWGVLPASLLPTICFLLPVLLAAAMAIPPITAYLDPFVRQAREDLKSKASLEKKGQ
ncbi:hypothetical protein SCLCIDRAFT_101313 [Scleroderma citrinum Foug A]|uniref:Uncharacterized protein n=1 Tax=Scleroderma citrinum Foug A TaxID=1036808 RepID=A0A0C3AYD4_9AGAM|nr:hypothetical protein SCLCIDRAFT_101313 [Scleroderma citrinum Foug A]